MFGRPSFLLLWAFSVGLPQRWAPLSHRLAAPERDSAKLGAGSRWLVPRAAARHGPVLCCLAAADNKQAVPASCACRVGGGCQGRAPVVPCPVEAPTRAAGAQPCTPVAGSEHHQNQAAPQTEHHAGVLSMRCVLTPWVCDGAGMHYSRYARAVVAAVVHGGEHGCGG